MNRLSDKTALVTGAGAGIGRAVARAFAAEGARVAVTDLDGEGAAETVRLVEAEDGHRTRARAYALDVTSEEDWTRVVAEATGDLGPVDVLVGNAGVYLIAALAETSLDDWRRVQEVNVTGVFLGMKHLAPAMAARGGGSIVNVSSVAGLIGAAGHAAYGASKGAVRILTKDAAIELAPSGVRVNSVHPAYIDTAMADYGAEMSGVDKADLGAMHPLGRIGTPADVAWACVYLASDEAAFVTGAELVVDGGYTAG